MPRSGTKSLIGQHAAAVRWNKPNVSDLARDVAASKIEDYISRVVAEAPPLTPAQRSKLAALLGGDAR